jgi:hypothetical protein
VFTMDAEGDCVCPRCTDKGGCSGWEPTLGEHFDYDDREKNCDSCRLSNSFDLYGCVQCSLCLDDGEQQI